MGTATTATKAPAQVQPPSIEELEREHDGIDLGQAEVDHYEGRLTDAKLAELKNRRAGIESKIRIARQREADERARQAAANAQADARERDTILAKRGPDAFKQRIEVELAEQTKAYVLGLLSIVRACEAEAQAARADAHVLRRFGASLPLEHHWTTPDMLIRRIARVVGDALKEAGANRVEHERCGELLERG